jgi:hypothetical protein
MSEEKTQLPGYVVKGMTPEQIVKAHQGGRLDDLLAGNDPGAAEEPFTPPEVEGIDQGARGKTFRSPRDWLQSLSPAEIVRLQKAGALDSILAGEAGHP